MQKFLIFALIALAALLGISYIDSKMKAEQLARLNTELNVAKRAANETAAALESAQKAYNATLNALEAKADREREARENVAAALDETLAKINNSSETLETALKAFNELNERLFKGAAQRVKPAPATAQNTTPTPRQNPAPKFDPSALPKSSANSNLNYKNVVISEDPREVERLFNNRRAAEF